MDNQTIIVIETLGRQWKLLLVLFIIIVFIVKWKTIWAMFSNFTQIKVKRGDNEFELHRNDKLDIKESVEVNKMESDSEIQEDIISESNKKETVQLYDEDPFFSALFERNFSNISALFEKSIEGEKNPSVINERKVRSYYLRYIYGDTSVLEEFEKYITTLTDNEQKSLALYNLGLVFKEANNNERAIDLFKNSLVLTNIDEQKVLNITKLSSIYLSNQQHQNSIDLLIKSLDEIFDRKSKVSLYKSLAEVYKKTENKLLESIAYQKALELDPNNTYSLFETAYNYSDIKNKLKDVGLLFYKKLLTYNPKESSALNNIGVAYQNLDLEFKAVDYYKKSYALENSLAAANIAYLLIDKGFKEEALKYLDDANTFKEPHDNVFAATSQLKNKISEEEKLEEKILSIADKKIKFFSRLGDAAFSSEKIQIDLLNWFINSYPSTISIEFDVITISWNISEEKHKISGKINNNAIFGSYEKPKRNIYSYSEDSKFTYDSLEGYGYFSSEKTIEFFFQQDKDNLIELSFKKE